MTNTTLFFLSISIAIFMSDCEGNRPLDLVPYQPPNISVIPSNRTVSNGDTLKITYTFSTQGEFSVDYVSLRYFDNTGDSSLLYLYMEENNKVFSGGDYQWSEIMDDQFFDIPNISDSLKVILHFKQFNCECNELHTIETIIYLIK